MAKTKDTITPTIIIVLLLITAALAYWFGFAANKFKDKSIMFKEDQPIESQSDLDSASDQLESLNPDAVDQGLNDLQNEISRY